MDIAIKITDKCDKCCTYCCEDSKITGKAMEFSILRTILEKAAKAGVKYVGITGGEPLLYKDSRKNIADVVRLCRKLDIEPTISTGGITSSKEYKVLNKIKEVNFVLSYSRTRKSPKEIFRESVKAIRAKNNLCAVVVVAKEKEEQERLAEFVGMVVGYDVHVDKHDICPVGRGLKEVGKVMINECQMHYLGGQYISFNEKGEAYPCVGIVEKDTFYLDGWKRMNYKSSLKRMEKESKAFCEKLCRYRGRKNLTNF